MSNHTIKLEMRAEVPKSSKPRFYLAGLLVRLAEFIARAEIEVEIKQV